MLVPTQVQMLVPMQMPEQAQTQTQTLTRMHLGMMMQMEAWALAATLLVAWALTISRLEAAVPTLPMRLEATVPTAVRAKALLPARAHPGAARALARWRVRRRTTGRSATSRFGRARMTRA